jgi:hypothetical protein
VTSRQSRSVDGAAYYITSGVGEAHGSAVGRHAVDDLCGRYANVEDVLDCVCDVGLVGVGADDCVPCSVDVIGHHIEPIYMRIHLHHIIPLINLIHTYARRHRNEPIPMPRIVERLPHRLHQQRIIRLIRGTPLPRHGILPIHIDPVEPVRLAKRHDRIPEHLPPRRRARRRDEARLNEIPSPHGDERFQFRIGRLEGVELHVFGDVARVGIVRLEAAGVGDAREAECQVGVSEPRHVDLAGRHSVAVGVAIFRPLFVVAEVDLHLHGLAVVDVEGSLRDGFGSGLGRNGGRGRYRRQGHWRHDGGSGRRCGRSVARTALAAGAAPGFAVAAVAPLGTAGVVGADSAAALGSAHLGVDDGGEVEA